MARIPFKHGLHWIGKICMINRAHKGDSKMQNHRGHYISIYPLMLWIAVFILPTTVWASDDEPDSSLVSILKFSNPQRDNDKVIENGRRLLKILIKARDDQELSLASVSRKAVTSEDNENWFRLRSQVKGKPNLNIAYFSHVDLLEAYDADIRPPTSLKSGKPIIESITRERADRMFQETFDSLLSAGLVSSDRALTDNIRLKGLRATFGRTGETATTEWIEEYMYFVPLTIEGIGVGTYYKEFGITVNVHRSGKIRRIEISGMGIASNKEGLVKVAGQVRQIPRKLDIRQSLASLFLNVSVTINPVGTRYILTPMTLGRANIPRKLYTVSPTFNTADGKEFHAPYYIASYAIDDANSKPRLIPKRDQ